MITINDVAKKAGVSIATASRALRNIGSIKPKTLAKVQEAAKELGYVVNTSAQMLKNYANKKVGFIISDISNDYYQAIQFSIKKALQEIGYEITLAFSSEDKEMEKDSFQYLIGSGVKAIFFIPTCNANKDILDTAIKNNIKVIQLFRNVYPDIDSIINDDEGGCISACNHLLNQGCKRILLFDVAYNFLKYDDVIPSRSKGFTKSLNNQNIETNIIHLPIFNYSKEEIRKEIERFQPDGVITATITYGYDVIEIMKSNKLEKNIKLVTYDDNRWLELLKISAIEQDLTTLAKTIQEFVKEDSNKPRHAVIYQQLVIR